jgi:hypothetical protein
MLPFKAEEPAAIMDLVVELDDYTTHFGPFDCRTIAVAKRLAVAFWIAGEADQAVSLLDQALAGLAEAAEREDLVRMDILGTLAQLLIDQASWERAGLILREVLDLCIGQYGETHANSLAVKGDLAAVCFELGRAGEALQLEQEALEKARIHLGLRHSVSCVLAWNRALRYELEGAADSARAMLTSDLLWLLTDDNTALDDDQRAIRDMLAQRFNWDAAPVC